MKLSIRTAALLALMAAMALPAAALAPVHTGHPRSAQSAPPHPLWFNPKKFMSVSQIKPGMRGYALTVFKGTKIQRFGVKILGVIKKFNQGQDYILFEATSGPSVTDHLNICHGMSGSPIYIDGKLAGAISMEVSNGIPGPSFGRDPIALATPIEEMFDAWNPNLPTKPESMSAGPPTMAPGEYSSLAFQPIDMPISVSGVTPGGIARLGEALAPYHFTLSAGGGGGSKIARNMIQAGKMLQPGAAVGVSLMQGDMDFTATGTVTYRDGNRVLLFGHPFFDLGPIDAALTTASVVGIYPSYEDSVKLGQPLETVGRIVQDRPFSVGGVIGSMPHMIPMTVSVDDLSIKRQKTFHVRIINQPQLTSQFVTMVAQQAVEQVHGLPGDSMATVTMDADVDEIGEVKRTNTFFDAVNISQAASADVTGLMQLLQSNPFYPLSLKSLKMSVVIRDGHDTAEIDHIFVRQNIFAPGDTIPIGVVLKPYKRAMVTEYVNVHIPADTPNGALTLSVNGGADDNPGMISFGGLILMTSPASSEPASTVAQLVKRFENKPRNNCLVAHLTLPTSALVVDGQKLTNLPPTMAGVMQATHSTGVQTEPDRVKVIQPMPYIVSGTQSLTITVKKKDDSETSTVPVTVTASMLIAPALAVTPLGIDPSDTVAFMRQPAASSGLFRTADADMTAQDGFFRTIATVKPAVKVLPAVVTPTATPVPPVVKPVGRLSSIWRQDSMTDFADGHLKNVSVTSAGDVRLSASLKRVADTTGTYLWAIQPDNKGNLYLATGNRGIIFKMNPDGGISTFFNTGQLEVTCLALDSSGNLYAGTAPHGIVYRITPAGKGSKFCAVQEKYVTALACRRHTLYIATGGGTGRIYAAAVPSGASAVSAAPARVFFTSPEANILSLVLDPHGNLYAGASPDGIVYKITPQGHSSVFYDSAQPNIASLAADSQGNIFVGTSPKGEITKVAPDGTVKLLYDKASSGILSLQTNASGDLYACAGDTIYRISPDETVQSYTAKTDQQFLTLGIADNTVYAGTGTVGSVYRLRGAAGDLQGRYQSAVHDAGFPAQWGTITWMAATPPHTQVALETRSGDVPQPDNSWSAWSSPYTDSTGETITSPPARYLQYQALLTRAAGAVPDAAPKLSDVTAYYLTRNRPPTVKIITPADGAALHKAVLLKWTATDPDGDTLNYDLSYSSDGGTTWKPITKRALPTGTGTVASSPTLSKPVAVSPQAVQTKVAAAMAAIDHKYPSLPAGVRKKLLTEATAAIQKSLQSQATAPAPAPAVAGSKVKETSFSWDTTEVPDGTYQVRVVASDKPSNPVGWLTAKAISEPFLIANTPPSLIIGAVTVHKNKTVTVHGVAQTKVAFVEAVQGHADHSDDVAALADNGIFDARLEPFTLTLGPLASGAHTITVEAFDQAQNVTHQTVNVTVP